jgi:hypothetical protein
MAFDQPTRNRLARFVGEARALLTEEFTHQMQNEYGLDPLSGEITATEKLTALDDTRRETARILRETLDYYLTAFSSSQSPSPAGSRVREVLERIVREQAFTVLNRLCALRMAEGRGLLIESVGRGYQSKGFQLYARLAGSALGETGEAYCSYLFSVFDEFALDLPVLFDRFSPQGRLFPREGALLRLLELINDPEIEPLWAEDETIGWIYQYFNSKEERQKMRAESQAPRNSRELAVRNQFFTPRYVVEFLTDNTLGRIWYEMTQGATGLKETCRYLVRRPEEVFLAEAATAGSEHAWDWSVEAADWLLKGDEHSFPPFETDDTSRRRLIQLASVVDGYRRYPKPAELERWELVRMHRAIQQQDDLGTYSLQELLDILFFMYRSDHWEDVEFLNNPRELRLMARIGNEVRRRVLAGRGEDLSQEELLRAPVFIPYRPLKDPREIKMLDPACGSMHFGLYAFDLFERIYAEAWELEEQLGVEALWRMGDLRPLHETYPDKASFLRDVPRLILERNIHGIDIDPRAVQIAGLSLWLRAQKSWQAQGLKPHERPQIRKSNVVWAEPMPGDRQMLEEFLATLSEDKLEALMRRTWQAPAGQKIRVTKQMAQALAKLVRTVWQEMELAGEAGSLLKIEETLREAIAAARQEAQEKSPLFRVLDYGLNEPPKEQYVQAMAGEDHDFFDRAEELALAALLEYAEKAANGQNFRRRLFAYDASQGFAFIDLCRKRYDVALMNPPFGDTSESITEYLGNRFPRWNRNILCAFIDRVIQYLAFNGFVGCVIDRTVTIKSTYETFRREIIFGNTRLQTQVNLGWGVLDDANVEVAALILSCEQAKSPNVFFDISKHPLERKPEILLSAIDDIKSMNLNDSTFYCESPDLVNLPNAVVSFEFPLWLQRLFGSSPSLQNNGFCAFVGHSFKSDRHFRLLWEIDLSENIEFNKTSWSWVYNGGDYSPYYYAERAIVLYGLNGSAVAHDQSITFRNIDMHGRAGIGYGKRGDFIDSQLLRSGHVFTVEGEGVPLNNEEECFYYSALLLSHVFSFGINLYCGQHKYPGYVNIFPSPKPERDKRKAVAEKAKKIWEIKRDWQIGDETDTVFLIPHMLMVTGNLSERISELLRIEMKSNDEINMLSEQIDLDFEEIYDLKKQAILQVRNTATYRPKDKVWLEGPCDTSGKEIFFISDLIQYVIGCIFGRWDLSYINNLPKLLPPDLNQPPNRYANGALFANNVRSDYPIKIVWDGILVNDVSNHLDITRNVRIVLSNIFGDSWDDFERDMVQKLKFDKLSTYLNNSNGFFDHHFKRYSKNHRIAPVYWPLSTPSCSYTLWLYYHRLNDQILYTCVNDFVEPKLKQVSEEAVRLRQKRSRSAADEKELERLTDFERELRDFRAELLRVAAFWKPNLNDGVQITAAPLWRLFQHKPWQKKLKETWEKLERGDYDWAHLAYSIWPERVREKCKTDKSLAIAHDLEELYVEPEKPLKKRKSKPIMNMDDLFEEEE